MDRYSRQIVLPEIGFEGQRKLLQSRVIVVGCGDLGTVMANNLCRAGIGYLSIVDRDLVNLSNLQRQMLFDEGDIGQPKVLAAKSKLERINSDIKIESKAKDVNAGNVENLIEGFHVVVDATDNFATRLLINDVCIKNQVPWIYAAVIETRGMILNISNEGACLRCLLPQLPKPGSLPTCETAGILNTISAIIASIACTETIKILLGKPKERRLIAYDVWSHSFDLISIEKNNDCRCCHQREFDFLHGEQKEIITNLCDNSVQIIPAHGVHLNLNEIAQTLNQIVSVKYNQMILQFDADGVSVTLFQDGRAIIKGSGDIGVAKSIYSKYLGN